MVYQHTHPYYTEDYEYIVDRVGIFVILLIIIVFHFFLRYFIINLSVSSLLSQFSVARKEIAEKRRADKIKQLAKQVILDLREEVKERNK